MYNRYIPQPDGSYRKDRIIDQAPPPPQPQQVPIQQEHPCAPPPPPKTEQHQAPPRSKSGDAGDFLRQLLPKNLDTGDLLIILLLMLMAGDCREDRNTALLTLALYLFM